MHYFIFKFHFYKILIKSLQIFFNSPIIGDFEFKIIFIIITIIIIIIIINLITIIMIESIVIKENFN